MKIKGTNLPLFGTLIYKKIVYNDGMERSYNSSL